MSTNGTAPNDDVRSHDYGNDKFNNGQGHNMPPNPPNSNGQWHYEQGNSAKPHQSMVSQVYNPSFYKIGNPGPLGLISFALTTFVLGLYQCGAGYVFTPAYITLILQMHKADRGKPIS